MPHPSAQAILSLTPVQARQLFPGDGDAIARRFRELAFAWHPDRNGAPEATRVFAHITILHAAATKKPVLEERVFETTKGKQFRMRWRRRHVGPLGEVLVGDSFIAHIVPADLDDLSLRAAAFRARYADDAMRREMARFLPRIETVLETAGGRVFIERKDADQALLADLATLGPLEPRQAAWMATRLVNLACWLQWSGVAHGAIGPQTLLVSPSQHSVALTGPFLCAGGFGAGPSVLPERTLDVAPGCAAPGARLDERLDPELVRLTLRELLGDPAGTRLAADPDFPKPFAAWLLTPAACAQADFAAWERAREASFGLRRFTPWNVDIAAMMAA